MNESRREQMLARVELTASVSWLCMDAAWMEDVTAWAVAFTLPTMLCSLAAIVLTRPDFVARSVISAMAAWAVMNSFWLFADLDVYSGLWVARSGFAVGVVLLVAAGLRSGSATALMREVLTILRRLRMFLSR
jgi:hypothetical protein